MKPLAVVLVILAGASCASVPILNNNPGPCGQYPNDCGDGTCCTEHNACTVSDEKPVCEFEGVDLNAKRRLRIGPCQGGCPLITPRIRK